MGLIRLGGPGEMAGRFGMGALLAGMGLGLAAQFALAWAWAHNPFGPPPLAVGAGVLVAAWARTLASVARDDGGADNEIAWIGLLVGAGLAVAFLRVTPRAGSPAVLAVACVWSAWWLTGYIWRTLLTAAPPPRDSAADPDRDAHGQVRGSGMVDIAANVHAGAFGGVLAAAAVALLGLSLRHGRPGPAPEFAALAMAVQCGCACLLVAQGQRRALLRQAQIYGAEVLPGFATGSAAGALGVTAALMALALLVPAYPAVRPHLHVVLGNPLAHVPAPGAGGAAARAVAGTRAGGGVTAVGGGPGAGAAMPLLLGLVGLAVAAALLRMLWLWARDGLARRGSLWESLRGLWAAFLEALAALFAGVGLLGLWRALAPAGAAGPGSPGQPGQRRTGPNLWQRLADPRTRVRAAYRQMLAGVGGKGHRRPAWFSPARFRHTLQPQLPPDDQGLGRLTGLYEEARYSTHGLDPAAAHQAEAAAAGVIREARTIQGTRGER